VTPRTNATTRLSALEHEYGISSTDLAAWFDHPAHALPPHVLALWASLLHYERCGVV